MKGDTVAIVTPSWGGPGAFPRRYEAGKRQIQEAFGVNVIEMPHALAPPEWVAANPKARAQDIMDAFSDSSVAALIASIGGDDAIRLLPHVDLDVVRKHPKVFLGFSDTTSLHLACFTAGLISFYGPSLMAGFAENGGMHKYTIDAVRRALFQSDPIGQIAVNDEGWTAQRTDWSDPASQRQKRRLQAASPPRILQGQGVASGPLIGGCAEVLEMVKGTRWWPSLDAWKGAILFYETSEDAPAPAFVRHCLRNFAVRGILASLCGILLARPDPQGDPEYQSKIEEAVLTVLAEESLHDMPVLSGLDFGHTQPMVTLPYGVQAAIDCAAATLTITEAGVV